MIAEPYVSVLTDEGHALEPSRRDALDVIVVGAGQAGLSVGYHLKRLGLRALLLDASERVGDAWRQRWDTLRLFTPAWLDSLDGLAFPAPSQHFPTKDEMADYLELYARHHELDVRNRVRVTSLRRAAEGYVLRTNAGEFRAPQVVIAMSNYQTRKLPAFARELSSDVVQLHSLDYKNPSVLKPGAVLIAGAGNSGAEIGMDIASRCHQVLLAGRDTGFTPFKMDGFWARLVLVRLLMRVFFHRVLTIRTPLGRKARPRMINKGAPLIRQRPVDLERAGIERTPRVVGARGGRPQLEDGRVLDVANVIWATGFDSGLDFIELPILDERGEPRQEAGVVAGEPGLYFVGQHFQYAFSSTMIHGVGRDAEQIARLAAARATALQAAPIFRDARLPARAGSG